MRNLYLTVSFFLLISPLYSYQWPSNKDKIDKLFGAVSGSDLYDGIKFSGEDQAVYPLTDGEILFYQDDFNFGDLDYSGDQGNLLILSHKGGFRSNYRNFTPTEGFDKEEKILQSEMIGVTSNKGNDFIFSIYDEKKDEYINPQQLLPLLKDTIAPVISKVYIKNSDSFIEVVRNKRVPSGNSELYIDAYDLVKMNSQFKKLNPFSIFVFIDGFERFHVTFSSIKEIDNKLFFSGVEDVPVSKYINRTGFLFGGNIYLTRGRSLIEIVIKDNNGNEVSKSYSVPVE